ncbi:helix-turn-helix domain-containing protein [Marinivivus vitaminiproducens]|uniref:helix-turn-helix domain-containing protein n=1 Tax=Marinivivus vitaminiproducens TaxID=3035935 RepID=UPI0027A0BFBF|nr:transcriptional regulator [Geminicoccaceae bacterium SCSIO 64248]
MSRDLRLIQTEADYRAAMGELESLWGAEPGTPEGDRLDVVLLLIRTYEDEHHAIPLPDPVELIRYTLEERGLKQKDLIPLFGSASLVSEVLSRKRGLTLNAIRALHETFDLPYEALIDGGRERAAA